MKIEHEKFNKSLGNSKWKYTGRNMFDQIFDHYYTKSKIYKQETINYLNEFQ